jgi:Ni/Co efflux regulator RcnB
MTVDELIDRVRQKTMIDASEITNNEMILWLNDGQDEVSNRHNWDWLMGTEDVTTIAGTAAYALTADYSSIIAIVEDGERGRLIPVTAQAVWNHYGDDIPSAQRAKYYYIYDNDLYLLPTPSTSSVVYHVYAEGLPQLFTATSDAPAFMETFHKVLADYVEARVWEREEEFEKAQVADNRFELGVRQMQVAYDSRQKLDPWAVGDGRPSTLRTNDPFYDDWTLAG